MPGIAGIIGTCREKNRAVLQQMVECMMHEPFYTSGIIIFEKLKLGVGWINHEGSFSDCMPVWNETKDICVIFSGEDFMEGKAFARLKSRDHDCNLENASYLVHLYEEMGLKFIEGLNGWFCGLLLDLRLGKAFLFNDRYGMHRIFVHENKDGIYFSSEAKALLALLPDLRRFDPKGVSEFLTFGCTLGNQSLYKGINILPAGALWEFEHGELKRRGAYFELEKWTGQQKLNEERFSYELLETFGKAVKRYSGSTLPVGVSLTGGLDSRMVMACLDAESGEFPCYTFGSMYRETFDVQTAREVAKACGQPHHVLVLGEEFLKNFQTYLEKAVYISDGYLGMSGAAELYVNSLAWNLAPVRLTGNYGGELLRGHRAFKYEVPQGRFISADLHPYLREAQKTFQELETNDPVTFALFHQAPSKGYGRLAIERSQVVLRTPFMENNLIKLVYQAPPRLLKDEKLSIAIISRYNPNLLKIPTDRGLLGFGTRLGGKVRKFRREVLIKAEYFASHGMPNWLTAISRYSLGRFLEKSFLGRDKFQHFRLWTEKRFADYIADVLIQGSRELGEFFNLPQVESMVHEHVAGKKNYIDEIDKLLTLILACNTLFKGSSFESDRIEKITHKSSVSLPL
jgi:asparagine synthase (glutamine-hydrolysing)